MIGLFDLDESDEPGAIVLGYYPLYVIWVMLGKNNVRYRRFMFVIATGLVITGLGAMVGIWSL